jgi:long-chain acyl-CoA synthetase
MGTIGLPLPGLVIDVVALDDPRRVLGFGGVGEMRIKGPNVFKGYWNKPEETAASFVDGFFLTGDIVYMQEDGYLFLVDRKKDMIISGGFNVYPQVIEQAIYEHPDVQEDGDRCEGRLSRRGGQGLRAVARWCAGADAGDAHQISRR